MEKPRIALVVPPCFDAASPLHQAERALAGELVEVLSARYRIDELGDASELSGHAFALVLIDRALAARCAARVPTRLVGSDTLYFNRDKWRIGFFDPRWDSALPELGAPPSLPAAIYVDHFVAADEAARLGTRLRGRHPDAPLYVSQHLQLTARVALETAFGRGAVELTDASQLDVEHLVSTDLATLCLVRRPTRKTLLTSTLRFCDATNATVPREDLLLYKGEEADDLRLATRVLAPAEGAHQPSSYCRPLISVVVPVYDRTTEIRRLADSILQQRYPNLEVLFVTNGSPPETLATVEAASASLHARGIHAQTLRFQRAFGSATIPRDIGCYAARGAFLCLLDSDDYLEEGFFDGFLVEPMSEQVLYSPKRIYRDAGRQMAADFTFDRVLDGIGDVRDGLYPLLLSLGNVFQNSGVIISREAFVRTGGIDHTLRYCEDYYLWLRLARAGSSTKEHAGRVNITFHPGNNELIVGSDPEWYFRARAAADRERPL